jgi:hypothetical protein
MNDDEYQKEIAEGYKNRVGTFSIKDLEKALSQLGVKGVDTSKIELTEEGNMNAAFFDDNRVYKINKDQSSQTYLANKIISDEMVEKAAVVNVLEYDFFEKSNYEVLIMKRADGTLLQRDIFDISKDEQVTLFSQVLKVVNLCGGITFNEFGDICRPRSSYNTFTEYLLSGLEEHIATIKKQKLCANDDIKKVEHYFKTYVNVFDNERSVFVHNDLHMGNILHKGDKLTAILDFDGSVKAPQVVNLTSLLGFISYPEQFVEGTPFYKKYKGKNFLHLLPILKNDLSDLLEDDNLLRKLNLLFVAEGIMWIADNWSAQWNKEMIKGILKSEIPSSSGGLRESYYGKILS